MPSACRAARSSVYTGLLPITKTEAGLAVVIAHEVAHALARHGAERMSDQMVASVGTAAAAVALSATVSGRSRTYLPAMMAAVGAGATVGYILPMSRAQESEADRIGLVLMALAGYDPREAVGLWERMRAASSGKRQAEWLSTHPADTTRIPILSAGCRRPCKYYQTAMTDTWHWSTTHRAALSAARAARQPQAARACRRADCSPCARPILPPKRTSRPIAGRPVTSSSPHARGRGAGLRDSETLDGGDARRSFRRHRRETSCRRRRSRRSTPSTCPASACWCASTSTCR
jgi:hypothetical protein